MKQDKAEKKILRSSFRAGLMLVIVAAVTLGATSVIQSLFTQRALKKEASARAESELRGARNEIMDIVNQAEAAVRNSLWIAEWCLAFPDSLPRIPQRVVRDNPVVVGSTIALVPGYNPKAPLYAPYVTRDLQTGEIRTLSLASEAYDYPSQEWFTKPLEPDYQVGYWSEPYFDEGGGDILMTTFSMPVRDAAGRIAAVVTADISLDWLTDISGHFQVYPDAFSLIISRTGQIMVCPQESLVMQKTVRQFASESKDSASLDQVNLAMLSGQSGEMPVVYDREVNHVYFAPVERTGWAMAIVLPEKDLYGGVRRVGWMVRILQLLGLAMLVLILRVVARNQMKYNRLNKQKERMQNELKIGHDIQMSMIPKTFPAFPDRTDLDFAASIIPAKEVGGDLYDFYIRDERLFFCIGDVSGKGVPASLVMAVTRSLFRSVSSHEVRPARIVSAMNDALSETNENNMFVTFFCGVLDMTNGHLRFCNAGHNPPLILTDTIRTLEVTPNIPLGVMRNVAFQEQDVALHYDDALFLYTDGLTEAENARAELFGADRMEAVLHTRRSSQGHLEAMQAAVHEFVGDTPQNDDRTMLFIHFLSSPESVTQERHLLLHNDVQQIPQLAGFIETIADELGLDQGLALNLNLALEEAVTNVILYAYPKGSDGLVDVEAVLREHSLEFIISDSGAPFDPTAAPEADVTLTAEERPIGGLGIYLVRQLMDVVRYERQGDKNVLTMIKKL